MKTLKAPILHHFTSFEGLIGILEKGFALMPCDRGLLDDIFGPDRPFMGDPQNFGMVCFTEAPLEKSGAIRKKGNYGIAVTSDWSRKNEVQKVVYLSIDKALEFQRHVRQAAEELKIAIGDMEDEGLKLAFRNKEFAHLMGQNKYADILDQYEYMQTDRDHYQMEWRVTQHLPFYDLQPGKIPSNEGWGSLYFKEITPSDIECLVCPRGKVNVMRAAVSEAFKALPVHEVEAV